MDAKKIRKNISRFFSWLGLLFCSLIVKVIPPHYLYGFAQWLAKLGYLIARKQRKIALESLMIAFGQEKTKVERELIVKDCFIQMAKSGTELFFFLDKPYLFEKQVELIGKDNLDAALSRGRGVILVSAHFGNFPLLLGRLSLEGYKSAGIMRPMRDSRTEKLFMAQRNRFGIKTIYSQPRRPCVEETIRTLRNNEIVFIPIDQNFGTGGVFVDFFGQKAATASGPVVLAQRTGAAIIPCFIVRQKDDTHKITFEKALELEKGNSPQETVVINIQKLTNLIESYIRRYPAQWGWIHRRWKTKPS